ncbi:MAG: ATP-dependent sacrificial sulfur transferase LarE [Melioribacteraceae bacterium]|nr:ATP-dependent sacrificial sulfur transferase LarE [Melioribacteraceae bacterium]
MNKIISEHKSVLESLQSEYQSYGKILIALSGGVDSCLAAFLGRRFLNHENAIAVISNSASLKERDYEIAVEFCKEHDIKYEVVYTNELEDSNYTSNPENRCYFCKNELYDTLNKLASSKYNNYNIINGNNYSDLGDYRPGLESATEQNVLSPFINCQITKSTIRELAFHFNLSVWNKPASPCLSSRFPYGEEISLEKLGRVEKAETILNEFGFNEVRVRSYGDSAIVEVPKEQVSQLDKLFIKIKEEIISIGFIDCEIDKEGFVSGKMNRVLNEL